MKKTCVEIFSCFMSLAVYAQDEADALPVFESDMTMTLGYEERPPWENIIIYQLESESDKIRFTQLNIVFSDSESYSIESIDNIYSESTCSITDTEDKKYWYMKYDIIPQPEIIEIKTNPIPDMYSGTYEYRYPLTFESNSFYLEGLFMSYYRGETTDSHNIFRLLISPNKQFLAGFLRHSISRPTIRGRVGTLTLQPSLWSAKTGELLIPNDDVVTPEYANPWFIEPLEILYSPDNHFCKYRTITKGYLDTIDDGFYESIYQFLIHTTLIDLKNMRSLEADNDVAFSPDGTQFVTVRNGIPTLVDAETDQNLAHFSISSPMDSATFSNNGEHLYIATEDNVIERFTTPFSTVGVSHWELY